MTDDEIVIGHLKAAKEIQSSAAARRWANEDCLSATRTVVTGGGFIVQCLNPEGCREAVESITYIDSNGNGITLYCDGGDS